MYFVNTNVNVYLYSHMIVALGKDDEMGGWARGVGAR